MPAETAPLPITLDIKQSGSADSFIPYPPVGENLEHVPIGTRPELHYYISRMGFLPHTIRLSLHTPWAAEHLFRLNNAVMRNEQSTLTEEFKYRLALIAS